MLSMQNLMSLTALFIPGLTENLGTSEISRAGAKNEDSRNNGPSSLHDPTCIGMLISLSIYTYQNDGSHGFSIADFLLISMALILRWVIAMIRARCISVLKISFARKNFILRYKGGTMKRKHN